MTRPVPLDPTATRHRIERRPEVEPDPERLVAAVARAILEIETGRRPLHQLDPLLSPALLARLSRRDDRARRRARVRRDPIVGPDASAVVRVVGQRLSDEVYEAVALVRRRDRLVAIAVRAERWRGGWRVTECARPEDVTSPDV